MKWIGPAALMLIAIAMLHPSVPAFAVLALWRGYELVAVCESPGRIDDAGVARFIRETGDEECRPDCWRGDDLGRGVLYRDTQVSAQALVDTYGEPDYWHLTPQELNAGPCYGTVLVWADEGIEAELAETNLSWDRSVPARTIVRSIGAMDIGPGTLWPWQGFESMRLTP